MNLLESMMSQPSGAIFSPDGQYRWLLWRYWGPGKAFAHLNGLNPSKADDREDDPTIRREVGFCKSWGMDGLVKTNAYGFKATNPKVMQAQADPIGVDNDLWIAQAHAASAMPYSVACWGANCERSRQIALRRMFPWRIFGLTKDGFPKHPLYLKATTPLVEWPL
jgi:hypothetical protein